ncbi:hypothetical protein BKA67DRAFT_595865 [Truncatella angustata]|uniref:Uncharacterized protein n=1 Tax=Truncatella angustata TaxID=152316 RepID=A0A9P8RJU8_9PEZI|nr:uncharacterized protein BKA67DRAFT_595865 [Truncatella angustata]KAH6645613.1 hypothetical protein BKA67DRAFT_595865 [Truncatella angustata]
MLPCTWPKRHLIPPKIWQILLPHPDNPATSPLDAKNLVDTPSWLEADDFVNAHFSGDAKVLEAWRALKDPAVKSDLLRYLMLFIEGGISTDVNTEALKPIDVWVPETYRDRARVVIGIEWDQLDGGTLAAKRMTTLNSLDLSSVEVMMSSGPASWTDVVLEQLKEMDLNVTGVADFSGMKPTGPRLYGDILILTIDGFGMWQLHSNSTHDGTIPEAALLKHKFRGSWRSSV